jgi:MoxR-like ATPase
LFPLYVFPESGAPDWPGGTPPRSYATSVEEQQFRGGAQVIAAVLRYRAYLKLSSSYVLAEPPPGPLTSRSNADPGDEGARALRPVPDAVGATVAEASDPDAFRATALAIEQQIAHAIIGQHEAVRGVLTCLIAGGHALLEGIPGVGKTSLVRAYAAATSLAFGRVQFTPDLMPADITGTTIFNQDPAGGLHSEFQRGPVFCNLLLADEINRASPRTQSALLEAMQEGTVTAAGSTYPLPIPFCVLATQNPVEMHGTYPLPEAQLDRFMLKLRFSYPTAAELEAIVSQSNDGREPAVEVVAGAEQLLGMSHLAREVPAATTVLDYIADLVLALQPGSSAAAMVRDYVRLGPSPRAAQALSLAGRIAALLDGRHNLSVEDVQSVAMPALRHRLTLSFDAEREGVTAETIVADALARVGARSQPAG